MSLQQMLTRRVEQMWWQRPSPLFGLGWTSAIYGMISRKQLAARAARAQHPPLPLISVGNITAGGSGKTPFVIWLTTELKKAGRNPVVLCRGDGGSLQEPKLLGPNDDPEKVGDEAMLLQRLCHCPVIAGRDRISGSRLAAELGDIIVLDDGFQYRQLQRTCDIVLIPAEGVGNGALIPAGPLREPLHALARADLLIRTSHHPFTATPLGGMHEWQWLARGERLIDWQNRGLPVPGQVVVLTGIARPQRFSESLQQLGIQLHTSHLFPDHHPFDADDVQQALSHGLPVATTAKDAVKLQKLWPASTPLWVLEQQAHPEEGLLQAIKAFVG